MAQIQPILDRIVIKKAEALKQTASGLFIPDTSTERPDRGVVIAVGPGRFDKNGTLVAPTVKVNDQVIFAQNCGQEVKVDKEEFLIMTEAEILAVVK